MREKGICQWPALKWAFDSASAAMVKKVKIKI